MQLENLVIDATDPARLARFWSGALAAPIIAVTPAETTLRLTTPYGPTLDICIVPVADKTPRPHRIHLDLYGGPAQQATVRRLLGMGARHLDIGQGPVPWTVLADPADYAFCVMDERLYYTRTGPLAALPIDATDPEDLARFWEAATGWRREPVRPRDPQRVPTLRHPSGRGPLLEFCPEEEPKRSKNPIHLDVRVDRGHDPQEQVRRLLDLGAAHIEHEWGELPWTVLADPSGNEFCVLPPAR